MMLTILNIGMADVAIILIILLVILALANYGRHTTLGYWGSLLIAIFCTPLGAFLIISYFRWWRASRQD